MVAIVGAESTGKTTLARQLCDALVATGENAVVVDESLRTFCDREGRTPRRDEQAALAARQTSRIDAAARAHSVVIADTTALMTAVYSEWVFGDRALAAGAEAAQRRYHCTLLTDIDLAWQADGLQRDGDHVRAPIDASIRAMLTRCGVKFHVIRGRGPDRLAHALAALARCRPQPDAHGVV